MRRVVTVIHPSMEEDALDHSVTADLQGRHVVSPVIDVIQTALNSKMTQSLSAHLPYRCSQWSI